LPPVPEMMPKVVNFAQELVAVFNRIEWQLSQELVAILIKNIHIARQKKDITALARWEIKL